MTFTTLTFALFLAIVFGVYWSLEDYRRQNGLLVIASYLFYAWWDWRFAFLMLASSAIDFTVGRRLGRLPSGAPRRRWLLLSLFSNLALLGFFKYFGFFTENAIRLAAAVGWALDPLTLEIILPVGISFYTFQTMSYTIDVYRRRLEATDDAWSYAAYVSFFPQLVAGPIERAPRLLPQFLAPRRFDPVAAADGCRQMLWGAFKKLVIADNLAPLVEAVYARPDAASGPTALLATLAFGFQIYCDFSAYSDIAIGTARLFGIGLTQNFAYPYFSRSLAEFWQRWHVSLSEWFRDYLYIPLGGSRRGRWRTAFNLMATFLVSGLWHGASWNFVIWGGIHGLAVLPSSMRRSRQTSPSHAEPGGAGPLPSLRSAAAMALTFAVVSMAWVFFRASSLETAVILSRRILFDWSAAGVGDAVALAGTGISRASAVALVPALVAVEWWQRRHPHPLQLQGLPRAARWSLYSLVLWLTLTLQGMPGPFIYFRF